MNPEVVASQASASTGRVAPFGKYLLLQRVSVGGMAEVYKAIPEGATRVDQIVAIKRILPNIAEDREFIGMFIDEARIAGQLDHPNICRIYELGRVNADHYIAMQFLWGRDLLKVMNRYKKAGQHLPCEMAALIAARAAAALHYAHDKCDASGAPLHIIHRDVSPQNIIVGYAGQTKLIDFGVARAASQSQKTQAGILKGKFGYMSPEMIRGLPVDHRSDVFAMGICLHEALTGARLFYGETDFATLELVRDVRVKPPSATAPHVPPELDAIVLRALAREPEGRYPTAGALADALLGFLARFAPGYGESQVAAQMRMAFAAEVAREKHRLDTYARMLSAGALVRGASIPALAATNAPPSGERHAEAGEPIPNAQTKPSLLSDDEVKRLSGEHELGEERTQIFFSTAELDQLRQLSQGPALSSPELGSVYPPAPGAGGFGGWAAVPSAVPATGPDGWPLPSPAAAAYAGGVAPEAASPSAPMPTPTAARWESARPSSPPPSTMMGLGGMPAVQAPARPMTIPPGGLRTGTIPPGMLPAGARAGAEPVPGSGSSSSPGQPAPALGSGPIGYADSDAAIWEQARSRAERYVETDVLRPAYRDSLPRSRAGTARMAVLGAGFLMLSGLTYFVLRGNASTATLTIEDVGDPDALVRVDGIVRGNPPLTVEGLRPGVHMLELQAAGSDIARTEVAMDAGETRSVRLLLTPQSVPPTMRPDLQPQPSSAGAGGDPAPVDPARLAPPSRGRRRNPSAPSADVPTDEAAQADTAQGDDSVDSPQAPAAAQSPANTPAEAVPAAEAPAEVVEDPATQINLETAAQNQGELLISTVPWSHVLLDGVDTGRDTPIRALRVPAGHHVLGLRTPDGETHDVELTVEPGRVVRVVRRF